ncbi:unnamed protein product [Didymodactylos carnosus]|uniref:Uncharacterized protein n=1 Tax=Didymodactylos carnosus TaxID=1234261 RepID=A0A814TNB4_9BILA|nr:unnamed protein product [Didymodactylos carnosus]CAF3926088.1 unnamed protein product [Didymodactylos carnosus]
MLVTVPLTNDEQENSQLHKTPLIRIVDYERDLRAQSDPSSQRTKNEQQYLLWCLQQTPLVRDTDWLNNRPAQPESFSGALVGKE